jgi:putative flavoprotein involved in K+ transport
MGLPAGTDTAIIGAGQAGLVMSHYLAQAGRDHLVIERRQTLGGGWQDRWDEFTLVSPNWSASFPGQPYDGSEPDAFMPRDEIADRVRRYAETIKAPVVAGTEVTRLTANSDDGFLLETTAGPLKAREVVVAIGAFHRPFIPDVASALPSRLAQVHSHAYRRETALPAGGVLVVGSGQSGVQIAEELAEAGRDVYLSVGTAGRVPRRYRGRDIFRWLAALVTRGPEIGIMLPTVDNLPSPRARFAGNPALSGHHGGHSTDLRAMAESGMTLLGRIEGVAGEGLRLAPGLNATLDQIATMFPERFQRLIDRFIELAGDDAPADDNVWSGFRPPELADLDLARAGISTVVWTTGYRPNYDWIDFPILDDMGLPKTQRGVSEVPGLYFLGLLWQHDQASATLFGPTVDGRHVAKSMGLTLRDPEPISGPA